MKYNILIGGSAGQGMETISWLLEKILQREGYYVFSSKDYMSRIRGGHNFIQVRFGDEEVNSHEESLDFIIALDENTIEFHKERLKYNGVILCDNSIAIKDDRVKAVPMYKISRECGNSKTFGTVAVGAVVKFFGISNEKAEEIFNKRWNKEVAEDNVKAFNKGYESVETVFNTPKGNNEESILINGNNAIALGALAGGVNFYSAYPMTPATSIMTYLSKKQQEAGILVEQVEDEISAINMAIGASYAGARAMTGTSGGGFSLMVEALGLSGIMEVPVVVVDSQRPGPATGLPTRTEQSDLSFVLTASHGETPRMVIAVRNPEDAFYQSARALNLADKYQIPVIILTDEYLSDCNKTIKPYNFSKVSIDRYVAGEEAIINGEYNRYRLTENGISPRLIPGKIEDVTVFVDSDEHDESGHITESADVRINMMNKRMKKLVYLKEELLEPEYFGIESPEVLLIGWGSTYGSIKDAVEELNKEGISTGALVFGDIYPLPTKLLEKYSKVAKNIVNVEQNYTGQLAKFIRQETGINVNHSILKYDGRQVSARDIWSKVKSEVLK